MSQQGPKTKFQEIADKGFTGSIIERGTSFIEAAELMVNHSGMGIDGSFLSEIKEAWSNQGPETELNKKDLGVLEKQLISYLNRVLYKGEKGFKAMKDELDNAENHINWHQRQEIVTDNIEGISRTETPITAFTDAQEQEWKKILDSDEEKHPLWFKALAPWEQSYFKSKVQQWQVTQPQPNLGDFLGTVPTTIRRYPGSPNAYHTKVTIKGADEDTFTFNKVRSGVLAPAKMKAKTSEQKRQKVEATQHNLEQLVLAALSEQKDELKKRANVATELPIILQTLYSPPFQPPGDYNNQAMMKAFRNVRKELSTNEGINSFLERNGVDPNDFPFLDRVTLMYSSRPVNSARGLSAFLMSGRGQGREADRTIRDFKRIIKNEHTAANSDSREVPDNVKIAEAALAKITKSRSFWNTVASPFKKLLGNNAMTEIAAYEQIVANQLGMRIGSCVSGKDREEMVTEVAIAQMQFYAKYKEFPPRADQTGKKYKDKRDEYVTMVAEQYLTGHGQVLAGENSKGCDGLKNVVDVFGKDIFKKIEALAQDKYGIDKDAFHPVDTIEKIAGINKLKADFLKKIKDVFYSPQATAPAQEPASIKAPLTEGLSLNAPAFEHKIISQVPTGKAVTLNPDRSAPLTVELINQLGDKIDENLEAQLKDLVSVEKAARSISKQPEERQKSLEEFNQKFDAILKSSSIKLDQQELLNKKREDFASDIPTTKPRSKSLLSYFSGERKKHKSIEPEKMGERPRSMEIKTDEPRKKRPGKD